MSKQRSPQDMAQTIVIIVNAYPHFVTPTMHAGIDLARALSSGDVAITEDAVLVAAIMDTYQQLEAAVPSHFQM